MTPGRAGAQAAAVLGAILLGVALMSWAASALWAPAGSGWALPVAGAVLAAAVARAARRGGAVVVVVPASVAAPAARPVSQPVPARQCDPAAPGRPRPRAPGWAAGTRAA
jgi:hypothetical protein